MTERMDPYCRGCVQWTKVDHTCHLEPSSGQKSPEFWCNQWRDRLNPAGSPNIHTARAMLKAEDESFAADVARAQAAYKPTNIFLRKRKKAKVKVARKHK